MKRKITWTVVSVGTSVTGGNEWFGTFPNRTEAIAWATEYIEQIQLAINSGFSPLGNRWLRVVANIYDPQYLHPHSQVEIADFKAQSGR